MIVKGSGRDLSEFQLLIQDITALRKDQRKLASYVAQMAQQLNQDHQLLVGLTRMQQYKLECIKCKRQEHGTIAELEGKGWAFRGSFSDPGTVCPSCANPAVPPTKQ